MVEIRSAAEQLATEQQERSETATRVEQLVAELEEKLGVLAAAAGDGLRAPQHGESSNGVGQNGTVRTTGDGVGAAESIARS
jgi:hypothetical protein